MRFRGQLIAGYAALLCVTLVTGTAAVTALRTTSMRLERVARDFTTEVSAVQQLRFEAEQLVAASRGYLLSADPKALDRFTSVSQRLNASLAVLRRRPELAVDVAGIEQVSRAYVDTADQAARRRTAASNPLTIIPFFESTLAASREQFEDAISRFVTREQNDFDLEAQHSRSFAARTQGMIVIATALGLMLSVLLAWASIRRLSAYYTREQAATAAARQAVAARDELVAIVSHDLRNPLATIAMATSLLEETLEVAHVRKHVVAIGNAAGHMRHLIDELLDVARLESGKIELQVAPCHVAAVLDATVSLFQLQAKEAGIELVAEPCSNPTVVADRERVLQVLANLLANALKFTPAGGRITLSAQACDGYVRIGVRDTGGGIPADQLPHLFERHWQGRDKHGGLGLGLYICKQLVEAHGGTIAVESGAIQGASFSFTLPLLREQTLEPTAVQT
jgi:signal transduction histidine kinase